MKLVAYCLYVIGILAVINTVIRFAENVHKYGSPALRKVVAGGSFVLNETSPLLVAFILMTGTVGLAITLSHLAGPPEVILTPDGKVVLDPFFFLT